MANESAATLLTSNQLVAYNVAKARHLAGLTQEEAAERLQPHLGERWSKATWSAAERSVDGERVRQFSADEIVALSQAFDVPIAWWFLPPGSDIPDAAIASRGPEDTVTARAQSSMIWTLFGSVRGRTELERRLAELIEWADLQSTGSPGPSTSHLRQFAGLMSRAAFRSGLSDLPRWRDDLRALADVLDQVEETTVEMLQTALETVSTEAPVIDTEFHYNQPAAVRRPARRSTEQ